MVHNKYGKVVLLLILLASISSACEAVQLSPKYTLKGTSTKTPFHTKSTFTPTKEPPPTFTPSQTPSPTEAFTSTPTATELVLDIEVPASPTSLPATSTAVEEVKKTKPPEGATVKVSLTTNCRTGPGISYPKLSSLAAGKTVPLIGRDASYSYWIIKDPGKTGKNCWLWGYYATTSGNTKNLKIFSAPGQPTAIASSTPVPTLKKTTPPATKTAKPSATPKTPLPTETPNLTPGTATNTPKPATATPVPSNTTLPSNTPVPSNTPTPNSGYCPYTSVLTSEEDQIRNLINQARIARGLPKLKIDFRLVYAARDHGRDMTCHGTYSHTSTDGTKAWERISVALGHGSNWCYNHCCCSEIFYGGSGYLTPKMAFNWWMTHPSQDPNYKDNIHKRTILSKYSTVLGVGVIYYKHDGIIRKFYTVDFARP
jgi:uncharacterized protein YkwD